MEEIELVYSEGVCKIFHNGELKHQLKISKIIFLEWKKTLLNNGYKLLSENESHNNYYARYVKE